MRIKECIKDNGLTINKIAEIMKISRRSVSNIINGNPTIATLERLAEAIGVPINDFFIPPTDKPFTSPSTPVTPALKKSDISAMRCPYCGELLRLTKRTLKDEGE
jgi:transcriptional regulator with XRE-family HTH domain